MEKTRFSDYLQNFRLYVSRFWKRVKNLSFSRSGSQSDSASVDVSSDQAINKPAESNKGLFFPSLLIYLFIWLGIYAVFQLGKANVFKPLSYLPTYEWIDPSLNIIIASGIVASILWFLLYLQALSKFSIWGVGFEFDPTKPQAIRKYFHLPLFIPMGVIVVSFLLLLILPPTCKVPGATFTVRSDRNAPQEFTPESEVEVQQARSIIVYLREYPSQKDLVCRFSASSDIIAQPLTDEAITPCVATIYLKKGVVGSFVLQTTVNDRICRQGSFFNLNIRIK